MTGKISDRYDVVVVGGGAAGLNGALMLARSRRSVLVVDAGEPRNAPAEAVHGLLGREGTPPATLYAAGRDEVRGYGGEITEGTVVGLRPGFTVELADGRSVGARRVLLTTGLADELPDIPGLRERWGRDLLHCPYCHGWEARDKAIGIIATGPMSVHQALLFRQLSADVVYFRHRSPALPEDQAEQLAARGVRVVEGAVTGVEVSGGALTGVHLENGTVEARDVLATATRMVARTSLLEGVGLKAVEHPMGVGQHLPADPTGRTEVPGLWAAGNVTDLAAQVGSAAAAGALAGAQINADLVSEDTREAVADYRARTTNGG